MSQPEPFDPLLRFAEIERLVAKIYYRFSHLFLDQPELRDFWWEMARDEEQHAAILFACKALIDNYDDERLDPEISRVKADELTEKLLRYLSHGIAKLRDRRRFSHRRANRRLRDRRHLQQVAAAGRAPHRENDAESGCAGKRSKAENKVRAAPLLRRSRDSHRSRPTLAIYLNSVH